jgi:hypothetical protein
MSIYLIIFASSLVLIVGMIAARILYKKLHDEHLFHKLVTHKARQANVKLQEKVRKGRKVMRYFNKKTFSLLVHLVIEEIEEYFHKVTDFIRRRFPHHK